MTETDLERRLRGALSARAAAVTSRDLRHEPAPSRAARRAGPARWWLPLTAGLAAAAVSITVFAVLRPGDPAPTPPAAPASPTRPAVPSGPASAPAPSRSPSPSSIEPTPTASQPAPTVAPTPS
ncbi:hypothetical protein [Actinoplanes sp. L3-i22]|uniref:hypothetical protein n=1 Tax=Actinoplanes sp. L3-i22 TaxID=2836373 RepID=UPI001C73F705|nr:hypothetical protein [Actinoplanes sp. L3-i22]BCY09939.1 hypothetical protein L3i22_050270 [Actinoplanes sp. L3-i22]